jgi:hypothetical protein
VANPRTSFVALVLGACALGALCALLRFRAEDRVEIAVEDVVRLGGGQAVLVLAEKDGPRRLAIPLTRMQELQIKDALRGGTALGPATLEALGGRVLGASIDEASAERGLRAHLALGSGGQELRVEASAGEALTLALEAGARLWADRAVLEAAGITRDELRGRRAKNLRREPQPAPVLGI